MFNWVVKVVPQPPPAGEETTKPAPSNKEVKKTDGESSSEESGMLGWLSNGFISALPQPTPTCSPRLSRSNSGEVKSADDGERSRVINWVAQSLSQSLTKAGLPQPDEKYREKIVEEVEHTEVFEVNTMPDYDPLPHIPVVEMESDDEDTTSISSAPQQVVNWIKQAMPQPALLPGAIETSPRPRPKRSITTSLDKVMSPPPQSLSGISLDTDDKAAGMVGWFVSGLGLRMPKLVVTPRDEMAADVLQKGGKALRAP